MSHQQPQQPLSWNSVCTEEEANWIALHQKETSKALHYGYLSSLESTPITTSTTTGFIENMMTTCSYLLPTEDTLISWTTLLDAVLPKSGSTEEVTTSSFEEKHLYNCKVENSVESSEHSEEEEAKQREQKRCSECNTTTSPLWRRGFNHSIVCNRCGLRWKRKIEKQHKFVVYEPKVRKTNSSMIATKL